MGTRGDFYIMDHDGSMEWLGSVSQDGGIFNIPTDVLISGDQTMYEEKVEEYLRNRFKNGIIKSIDSGWPWPWADSRLTDYTYIFHVCTSKVLVCIAGGRPMDAIKLVQGMDELGADVGMGKIKFPVMLKDALKSTEETVKLVEGYGQESTEAV